MRWSIRSLLLTCGLLLLVPSAAMAQAPPTMIDGDPLNIWTDADGSVQVNVEGFDSSEWFPQFGPSQVANAGFGVLLFEPGAQPGGTPNAARFGKFIAGGMGTPEAGPVLLPGTPNPTVVTSWTLSDGDTQSLRASQVLSYVNGERQFTAQLVVENTSQNRVHFRVNMAGDLAIRGTDSGVGFLTPGPPRFMGGVNQEVGAAGGFVEATPWSSFESNQLGIVSNHASEATVPGGFDNSISTESSDNAAGVQWDTFQPGAQALEPGAEAVFTVQQRYIDTLGLTPPTASKLTGEEHVLTANVGDLAGAAVTNQTIAYEIQGSNNRKGKVNTGADGTARIRYVGGAPGQDTVTAWVDSNGNEVRDENEAQAQATVDWEGPPAPVIGQDAGVRPVGSGVVRVRFPAGASEAKAKRLGLAGATRGFVRLTEARNIPIGSQLDVTKGTVKLLTAAGRNSLQGQFQSGNFKGGRFRLGQSSKNPLTTLSMQGGNLNRCNRPVPRGGAAAAGERVTAAARRRRLFGRARGRFRTRGRNSSATVRGTVWTMTDTCRGTLTSVKEGTVVVRDFTLRKNRVVKAGKRYLAKPPKRRRRR